MPITKGFDLKKEIVLEKYPVFTLEIDKTETSFTNVQEILDYFGARIGDDPIAVEIGRFDHFAHTRSVEGGEIAPDILDAKNIVFCFGQKLPDPKMLAVRPRSIGVAEKEGQFIVTFLEAPMQPMNAKMEAWAKNIINRAG